ncbi:MAG: FkbM family methyltransferase [Lentisphaerae bacterium]|nr:FkbM family methyltransferase [Lentisphaerota bacterium]MCP4102636.1 FkbM family methyltransferase [Lentisphaerota bacterium]
MLDVIDIRWKFEKATKGLVKSFLLKFYKRIVHYNAVIKSEIDSFCHLETFWIVPWKNFLKRNYSKIPKLSNDLFRNLDDNSIESMKNLIWLYDKVLLQKEYLKYVKYDKNILWTKSDISNRTKLNLKIAKLKKQHKAYEAKLIPCDISMYVNGFGLNELPESVLNEIKGMDVIDGGAWHGDSSIFFSQKLKGNVYAFEPNVENHEKLCHNINKCNLNDKIYAVNKAIYSKTGYKKFYVYGKYDLGSGLKGQYVAPERDWVNRSTYEVQTIPLDDYHKDNNLKIGLIKLDIEGAELNAIKAAQNVIIEYEPVIICAIYHSPFDFFYIKPYLESLGVNYKFKISRLSYDSPFADIYLIAYVEK